MELLKVASSSNPSSIGGVIANTLLEKEENKLEIQCIGAGALNQAIKGIAIARGFLAPAGKEIVCIPSFTTVQINGESRTGLKLVIKEI
ncbi:MAG: stage V sporulation protein S [Clostridia bacterium]|nr:stage V sporulation protein S [Clostridia bacterium]